MEYCIGVQDRGIAIKRLLEQRLPKQEVLAKQLYIQTEQVPYVYIAAAGNTQTLLLADILADILVENLQIRFLVRRIRHCCPKESKQEQYKILIEVVHDLWKPEEQTTLEQQKREVGCRIAKWLLQEKKPLMLDGFFRFRMKDFTTRLEMSLQEVLEMRKLRKEQKELVQLLRYLVSTKDPLLECVYIQPEAQEYLLFDEEGRQIQIEGEVWEPEATKEEKLVLCLVAIAPEKIYAQAIQDAALVQLLREVFPGRVRYVPKE